MTDDTVSDEMTTADADERSPTSTQRSKSLSRRRALGAFAATGAAIGWLARDRLPWGGDGTDPSPGEDTESSRGAVWDAEAEIRSRHETSPVTLAPTFEYEPVRDVTADEGPIVRASAVAADDVTGDRAAFVVDSEFAPTFAELAIELWANPDEHTRYETTVVDRQIDFRVFRPEIVALGLATVTPSGTDEVEELLIARAEDVRGVERLVETFDEFYASN